MSDETHFVFVYGSLKQGFGNHRLLEDSKYIGPDYLLGYQMYSLGGFPAICPTDGREVVSGEIYEVDDETFERLDILEGYPNFYNREETVAMNRDMEVWVYFHDEPPNNNLVVGGMW